MKTKLQLLSAILLLGLVFSVSLFGQTWTAQTSGTPTKTLLDVDFIDANTGWVVGEDGTILVTVNGGDTWSTQSSPSDATNFCYEVQFLDATNGFIAAGSALWVTTNGGVNWSEIAIPNGDNVFGVHFFTALIGYIAGNNESIYFTINGGTDWTTQRRNTSGETLSDISFYDATAGVAVGSNGKVLKTTDGSTWNVTASGTTTNYVSAVQQISVNDIVAVASNNFIYTSNGGDSWLVGYPGYHASGLCFATVSVGRVVCEGGHIMNTIDGGASWNEETSGVSTELNGIDFVSADVGYIVGASGVILKTNNGSTPVELTQFTVATIAESVVLNWQTATEVNNYGFEIERQILKQVQNDDNWETIGFVEGHGNSNSPKEYSFIDSDKLNGAVQYRLKQIDIDGAFEYSDVVEVTLNNVLEYKLSQNHPNPFNPSTQLAFTIPSAGVVKLNIYNVLGEVVSELVNENLEAGFHQYQFNASNLTSGIYFYSISVNGFVEVKKMNLIK